MTKKAHKKTDAVVKTQTTKPIADSTEKTVMIPVEKLLKPDDYFRKEGLDAEAKKMLFKEIGIKHPSKKPNHRRQPDSEDRKGQIGFYKGQFFKIDRAH